MASLWDKLTGKAPFVEDKENTAEAETNESSKETKVEPKAKKPLGVDKLKSNEDLHTFGKWFAPIAICFALIIVANVAMNLVNSKRTTEITQQQDKILKLNDEITIKGNEYYDMTNLDTAAKENVSSADDDTSADDALAIELFKTYTTWSSGDEYENLRMKAINDEGFSAAGSFVKTLLPEQGSYQDKNTGTWYYQIDSENLNCKYESLDTYKLDANGNYAAILKVSMIDKSSTGMNAGKIVSIYTTYNVFNGSISNIECALLED